jgi:hypothetical protein
MMVKRLVLLTLISLIAESLCSAQLASNKNRQSPTTSQAYGNLAQTNIIPVHPVFFNALKPVKLPQPEGSWAVQIVSRGGVMGTGKGDLIITSEGEATLTQANSTRIMKLSPEAIMKVAQVVAPTKPANWNTPSDSLCNDCYVTMLVLYRRQAGIEHIYTVEWDDITKGKLPEDVIQLYVTAMSLKEDMFASWKQ